MNMKRFGVVLSLVMIVTLFSETVYACTTGVCHGNSTLDGRPMIWHNRDYEDLGYYLSIDRGSPYDYIGQNNSHLCLNEKGVAFTLNYFRGTSEDYIPRQDRVYMMQNFDSLSDIRSWIENHGSGIDHIGAFMGPETSTDGVAVFEISDNFAAPNYWEYNPMNETRKNNGFASPYHYAFRANAAFRDRNHCEPDSVLATHESIDTSRFTNVTSEIRNGCSSGDILTIRELLRAQRWGDSGVHSSYQSAVFPLNDAGANNISVALSVALGINAGENGYYATYLYGGGHAEYSIVVPCYVALSSLHSSVSSPRTSDSSTMYWSINYFKDYVYQSGRTDYDDYFQDNIVEPVEDNLIEIATNARTNWFSGASIETPFSEQIDVIHTYSASAVYDTIRSAYETETSAAGPQCNIPPQISSLGDSVNGNTLTLAPEVDEAMGFYEIHWGDGSDETGTSFTSKSHTYSRRGTYMVALYVRDNDSIWKAANVKFKYIAVGRTPDTDADADADSDADADGDAEEADGAMDGGTFDGSDGADSGEGCECRAAARGPSRGSATLLALLASLS